jgi:hypothetical protein
MMNKESVKQNYLSIVASFSGYWHAYGGIAALLRSPYLHLAVALSFMLVPLWKTPGWWDIVISTAPSILGFSLAGYAIWLALGDSEFRSILAMQDPDHPSWPTPFMEVNATFFHFLLLQVVSLVFALFLKAYLDEKQPMSWCELFFSWIGFTVFVYALLCVLAATLAVLRSAHWYQEYMSTKATHKK